MTNRELIAELTRLDLTVRWSFQIPCGQFALYSDDTNLGVCVMFIDGGEARLFRPIMPPGYSLREQVLALELIKTRDDTCKSLPDPKPWEKQP